jgi:hypothetical protein
MRRSAGNDVSLLSQRGDGCKKARDFAMPLLGRGRLRASDNRRNHRSAAANKSAGSLPGAALKGWRADYPGRCLQRRCARRSRVANSFLSLAEWAREPIDVFVAYPPSRRFSTKVRVFVDWEGGLRFRYRKDQHPSSREWARVIYSQCPDDRTRGGCRRRMTSPKLS